MITIIYRHYLTFFTRDFYHVLSCSISFFLLLCRFKLQLNMHLNMMIDEDILLARGAIYRKIKKGEFIFHEGSKCNYYFQLIEGQVSWLNFDDEGKIFIQSIIEPGECFGELPLFDGEPYAASALADTNCVVLQLVKQSFFQLLSDSPELLFSFSKLLAQRIRYKFFILKEIACHSPEEKVLVLLNHFTQKSLHSANESNKINLTRQQLASMTGLRVETVIKVIRKLYEKGKLIIKKGKIFMINDDSNHKD